MGFIDPRLLAISSRLRDRVLSSVSSSTSLSIFLCGGSSAEQAILRRSLGDAITNIISKYTYFVYYPEDLFVELIKGHAKQDLLSLENILANSVSSVVILLNSPGTFAELGAFANHDSLKNKLIVVMDPRYKRATSFINFGPIRYLKAKTKSLVLYEPLNETNLSSLARAIAEASRDVSKESSFTSRISNPVIAYRYYLTLIYVLEPVPLAVLRDISKHLLADEPSQALAWFDAIIRGLTNDRKIALSSGNLSITSNGVVEITHQRTRRPSSEAPLPAWLTALRLSAMNLTLRRNYSRIWEKAKGV